MNVSLFCSSCIVGIIIIVISLYYYNESRLPFYMITYIGILTSIINHGGSNEYAKYLDRCIMGIAGIIYLYYSFQIQNDTMKLISISIVCLMTILYFFSKYIKNHEKNTSLATNIHIITHFLSIISFCIIISNNNESPDYIDVQLLEFAKVIHEVFNIMEDKVD